jgi:uncharacterized DUF497 family protein
MRDAEFEWDDDKAAQVVGDPDRVSFEDARLVFRDTFGVGYIDDREDYGEERWIRIGMIQVGESQMLVTVVYTEREGRKRIISNWRATKDEQDDYFQQNASD